MAGVVGVEDKQKKNWGTRLRVPIIFYLTAGIPRGFAPGAPRGFLYSPSGCAIGSERFNGLIDDIKVYNYARTAEQIKMDYQQGVATRLK